MLLPRLCASHFLSFAPYRCWSSRQPQEHRQHPPPSSSPPASPSSRASPASWPPRPPATPALKTSFNGTSKDRRAHKERKAIRDRKAIKEVRDSKGNKAPPVRRAFFPPMASPWRPASTCPTASPLFRHRSTSIHQRRPRSPQMKRRTASTQATSSWFPLHAHCPR